MRVYTFDIGDSCVRLDADRFDAGDLHLAEGASGAQCPDCGRDIMDSGAIVRSAIWLSIECQTCGIEYEVFEIEI